MKTNKNKTNAITALPVGIEGSSEGLLEARLRSQGSKPQTPEINGNAWNLMKSYETHRTHGIDEIATGIEQRFSQGRILFRIAPASRIEGQETGKNPNCPLCSAEPSRTLHRACLAPEITARPCSAITGPAKSLLRRASKRLSARNRCLSKCLCVQ